MCIHRTKIKRNLNARVIFDQVQKIGSPRIEKLQYMLHENVLKLNNQSAIVKNVIEMH